MGETGRRLIESAKDEGGQDAKLHLFKHAIQTRHIWYHYNILRSKENGTKYQIST